MRHTKAYKWFQPMSDRIYGLHQSQPQDVYAYMRSNAKPLGITGRVQYRGDLGPLATYYIPEGIDLLFDDRVYYDDEPLMDGRVRRYDKVKVIVVNWSATKSSVDAQADIEAIKSEMADLGYDRQLSLQVLADPAALASAYSVDAANYVGANIAYAETFEIFAGVPSYRGRSQFIEDAPNDGQQYSRQGLKWVLSDHQPHDEPGDIDGGLAQV